jgi:ribulose-5-phosphate 4-epimerase/fuculose-1-phosphate aldolase
MRLLALGVAAMMVMTAVTSSQTEQATVVDDLVIANRVLVNEGVLDGLGHISARHPQRPDRFLLSRDLPPALVTPADLVEYDLEGNATTPNAPRGYSERAIHAAIYKARPDVRSIVHAHTPSVVTFSVSSTPLRPVFHVALFLIPGTPIFDLRRVDGHQGMLVNDMRSGAALAQVLGDRAVALMRGHGYVAVGGLIPETVHRSIVTDVNARMQMQALSLGGTITYLSAADVGSDGKTVPPTPQVEYVRNWLFWKARVEK